MSAPTAPPPPPPETPEAATPSPPPPPTPRALPAIHRLAPRAFYGWFIVAGTFALSFVAVGIGFYGQTVFLDALIREKGWSKESVSAASTFYFVVSGLAGIAVGRVVDRRGHFGPLLLGSVVMAGGLLALGSVDTPAMLFPVYTAIAIGFAMTAGVPLNAVMARWFVRRRAFAMSLSQTGVSLGGIVLTPFATLMIAERGIEATTALLAVVVMVVMWPITIAVIRWDPRDYGLWPDGQEPASDAADETARWRTRDVVRTSDFRRLALGFSLILFCQTGLSVHLLHLLREHLDAAVAASGVSLVALGSIIGRLGIGQIADRADKRHLGAGLFAVQAVAHCALSFAEGPTASFAAAALFGLTIGSVFMLQSLLVMECFGVASFGTVFGALNLVTSMAGGLGPLAVGAVASAAGYPTSLLGLALLAAVGAVTLLRVSPPGARTPSPV